MTATVYLALLAWLPLAVGLFYFLPPRRAALAVVVLGTLFLPVTGFPVTGFKGKLSIISVGLLAGSVLATPGRWLAFRPRLIDLPVAACCAWPIVSSLANGLGNNEAGSALLDAVLTWGVPYLVGRVYFTDREGLRELAVAVFVGGLLYVPFCLWEIRMSPQLHYRLYGFWQHSFDQTLRGGGYRPMVFMQHGLMVGLWMTAASVAGTLLWRSRALRSPFGVPMIWLVALLLATAALCKSIGALVLLVVALAVAWLSRRMPTRALLIALALVVPGYVAARTTAVRWSPTPLISMAAAISSERADSLRFRLHNEELIVSKALTRPLTGWGRWGRFLIYDSSGHVLSVPDALWVIQFGQFGVVGLGGLVLMFGLPVLRLAARVRPELWNHPAIAPAIALALIVTLFAIDSLFNGMINPVYNLAVGALAGFSPAHRRALRRPRPTLPTSRSTLPSDSKSGSIVPYSV